jgi:phosphoglycolate phosphatase
MVINRAIPAEKIRLLIFDLDGTLIDSRLDLAHSVNAMLRHLGRPELPEDAIASYVGDGAPMLVRRALGDPDDEQYFKAALEYFLAYYREHKLDFTYVYEGVIDALRAIRTVPNGVGGRQRHMAVLTNKPVNPSKAIVEALGLGEFMTSVYGGNSFPTKKPDPLGAQTLLREYGVRPEEAAMIGDSENDVLTGRNTAMWTVGVTYGFAPESLRKVPPDVLIDQPRELIKVLGN